MSVNQPPSPNVDTFNNLYWISGDTALTQGQADLRYLKWPVAQGTENLQTINVNGAANFNLTADFNSTVNVDGILTTTNAIDMIGSSTALNNISTRQLSLKDATNGNSNGSSILTNTNILTVDSVGPNATNTSINFALRNTANAVITPLQLTTTINNMNVALDMTNTGSYTDAIVKSRLFGLRDLTTAANTNCGMYFSSNILQIDSTSATPSTITNMFLRTTKADNTLTNALQLTNTTVKTDCYNITALPANDNSNSIPTTTWVQNLVSSYTPASSLRRAWKSGNFTGGGGNSASDIIISDCGTASTIWQQNETITLRVSFHQQWLNRATSPTDSTLYQTVYANVTLYPYRFISGWLNDGGGPQGAPRGEINQNGIYATAGLTTAFAPQDATYFPNGRQFWCDQLQWAHNTGSTAPVGRIYICGISGNVNGVRFIVANPYGFNTVPSGAAGTYSFNFSVELLNAGETSATITTSNFNVNF